MAVGDALKGSKGAVVPQPSASPAAQPASGSTASAQSTPDNPAPAQTLEQGKAAGPVNLAPAASGADDPSNLKRMADRARGAVGGVIDDQIHQQRDFSHDFGPVSLDVGVQVLKADDAHSANPYRQVYESQHPDQKIAWVAGQLGGGIKESGIKGLPIGFDLGAKYLHTASYVVSENGEALKEDFLGFLKGPERIPMGPDGAERAQQMVAGETYKMTFDVGVSATGGTGATNTLGNGIVQAQVVEGASISGSAGRERSVQVDCLGPNDVVVRVTTQRKLSGEAEVGIRAGLLINRDKLHPGGTQGQVENKGLDITEDRLRDKFSAGVDVEGGLSRVVDDVTMARFDLNDPDQRAAMNALVGVRTNAGPAHDLAKQGKIRFAHGGATDKSADIGLDINISVLEKFAAEREIQNEGRFLMVVDHGQTHSTVVRTGDFEHGHSGSWFLGDKSATFSATRVAEDGVPNNVATLNFINTMLHTRPGRVGEIQRMASFLNPSLKVDAQFHKFLLFWDSAGKSQLKFSAQYTQAGLGHIKAMDPNSEDAIAAARRAFAALGPPNQKVPAFLSADPAVRASAVADLEDARLRNDLPNDGTARTASAADLSNYMVWRDVQAALTAARSGTDLTQLTEKLGEQDNYNAFLTSAILMDIAGKDDTGASNFAVALSFTGDHVKLEGGPVTIGNITDPAGDAFKKMDAAISLPPPGKT